MSPLPPVRSGIADYTLDLVPHLAELCDLRLVRVPGQPVAEAVMKSWGPVEVDRLAEDGRLPLFQMGNNAYHETIWELALERPGVVTLHDLFLHHLLSERTVVRGDADSYTQSLLEDHGWIGGAVSLPPRWGAYGQAALFSLPAHRSLLAAQRGVLVHSRWAAETLRAEGITTPVTVVPMPMPLPGLADRSGRLAIEFRRRLGLPGEAFVVGSFGFQTPIKRTASVIRALGEPGLEGAHLIVAGEVSPQLDLGGLAESVGASDRVHVTGFLDQGDFAAAVAASDVCVNLRHPTAGETSASLLRVLACGRGALVSRYGQFEELPEEAVIQIPLVGAPGEPVGSDRAEVLALVEVLGALSRDGERVRELGEQARRFVASHHQPERSARRIVEACEEWQSRAGESPREPATRVDPPPPTSLTWGALECSLSVRGQTNWPEGERREIEIELRNQGVARLLPADQGRIEHGGVALQVWLLGREGDSRCRRPWLPLPRALSSGESFVFRVPLRRPLGPSRLRVEPIVLGGAGLGSLGGAPWECPV